MKENIFVLNQNQKDFLSQFLPNGYSFQIYEEEQKRIRVRKFQQKQYPQQPPMRVKPKVNKTQQPPPAKKIVTQLKSQKISSNQFNDLSNPLKVCIKILNKLKKHESAWPFLEPVDPVALHVPNYLKVVKDPIDLTTIENKLRNHQYEHPAQFHADINKIFLNSYKFNPKSTIYYQCTLQFEAYYNQILEQIKDQSPINSQTSLNFKQSIVANYNTLIDQKYNKAKQVQEVRNITQMKNIIKCISRLKSKRLQSILNIIYNDKVPLYQSNFEIDLTKLSDSAYQELKKYLNDNKLSTNQINQSSPESYK